MQQQDISNLFYQNNNMKEINCKLLILNYLMHVGALNKFIYNISMDEEGKYNFFYDFIVKENKEILFEIDRYFNSHQNHDTALYWQIIERFITEMILTCREPKFKKYYNTSKYLEDFITNNSTINELLKRTIFYREYVFKYYLRCVLI